MSRELHLLAFGNTRSAGPWRYPGVDNSTSGVRRRLIERARLTPARADPARERAQLDTQRGVSRYQTHTLAHGMQGPSRGKGLGYEVCR